MSGSLRITGMASGLDIDALVKQMMKAESVKVDKLMQTRQQLQWKQDIFRDLIGELNTFKNTYFNVAKPDTYILSQNNYSSFEVKSSDTTNSITATAQSKALAGNYKVSVGQLAEKALYTSSTRINTSVASLGFSLPIKIDSTNNELTIDGKQITLADGRYNNLSALASHINTKIGASDDLKNTVKAVVKNNEIQFAHTVQILDEGAINNEINITTGSSTFKVTLNKGYYTLDETVAQINNQLKNAKDASGNGIPAGFMAKVADDGKSIIYENSDGSITGSDDKNFTVSLATVGSTGTGATTGTKPVADGVANKISYINDIISGFNDTIKIKVGATTYDIMLDSAKDYSGMNNVAITNEFVNQINLGIGNLTDINGVPIDIGVRVEKTSDDRIKFISSSTSQVSISGNAATMLGVPSGFEVSQSIDDSITNLITGKAQFTVNGKLFSYDFNSAIDSGTEPNKVIGAKNKTLSNILDDISYKANVDINYSQLTRNFTLTSKTSGADQIIVDTKDDVGNFLETLFGQKEISDASGNILENAGGIFVPTGTKLGGKDSIVTITEPNGAPTTTYQSTNNFTIDGVTYTLNEKPASDVTLTLVPNASGSLEKIKGFVNKYNEIIEKINNKLIEKKQTDYLPLTDDQKESMKEDDIKKWEEKAKEGLIRGDSTLENTLYNIRKAFFDSVKVTFSDPQMSSIGITLKDVGMSTSSDTTQRGKIIIDEEKLKEALQNNGDKVAKLFTKASSTVPHYSRDLTKSQRDQRYSEEGIFQRIKDILEDSLSTMRDSKGNKGILLEKAGIKGDFTEYHNFITDELDRKDKIINNLNRKLIEKEEYYYLKFAKLETAMQQLNSQQSWFSQQMSAMSGGY